VILVKFYVTFFILRL